MTDNTTDFPSLLIDEYDQNNDKTISIHLEMLTNFGDGEYFDTQQIFFKTDQWPANITAHISKQSYSMVATKHLEWTYAMFAELIRKNDELAKVLVEFMFDSGKRNSFENYVAQLEGYSLPHQRLSELSKIYFK